MNMYGKLECVFNESTSEVLHWFALLMRGWEVESPKNSMPLVEFRLHTKISMCTKSNSMAMAN